MNEWTQPVERMRSFRVGGGLVVVDNQLLLAANRRRQGTLEWTPPGGVIDEGESVTEGISREVREETGLHVRRVMRVTLS